MFMKPIHKGHITRNKDVMMGKPCIKGATVDWILEGYPHINADDICACLDYARAIMKHEEVIELVSWLLMMKILEILIKRLRENNINV